MNFDDNSWKCVIRTLIRTPEHVNFDKNMIWTCWNQKHDFYATWIK